MGKSLSANRKIIYTERTAVSTPMFLDVLVPGANKLARGYAGYGKSPQIIRLLGSRQLSLKKMIATLYPFHSVIDALDASIMRNDCNIMTKI
jgi:hypothetical protein